MNIVDAIYHIKYNPFKYGEYIYCFYHHLENHYENILLLPLILPICTHSYYGDKVKNSKSNSSIYTIFKEQRELLDFQERVDNLKELGFSSLQYCLNQNWLYLNPDKLNIVSSKDNIDVNQNTLVAKKLAMLFSRSSKSEIYSLLGVKL